MEEKTKEKKSFFEKIAKKPTLTNEEWAKVAFYLQNGSDVEKDQAALVLKNRIAIPIVSKILRDHRIAETVFESNYHTPDTYRDDLINTAWTEAFLYAKKFDPSKGASLQSFLYKYVYGTTQRQFYKIVMQGSKPFYKKGENGKYYVVVTSTHSLSDKIKMKNKESRKTVEDTITNPVDEMKVIVGSDPAKLARLISYAQKELTPPLFRMFLVYLRGERNTVELEKLSVVSRQRFYSLLKKIKRDFSLKNGR